MAARTETVLPPGELPRATSRGLGSVPPLAPVVLEGRIIGGMRGGDQPMADDLGPGEFPERPVPLLILKDPAVWSCTSSLRIIPSHPKPGKMPHINTCWRGQRHGVTSCCLSARPVRTHLALHHVVPHPTQAPGDGSGRTR